MKPSRAAILTGTAVAAILTLTLAAAGCKDSNTVTGPTPAGHTVSGTVTLPPDHPPGTVAGAEVTILQGSSRILRTTVDASDRYSIRGAPTGSLTVMASKFGYRSSVVVPITLAPDTTGVDLHLGAGMGQDQGPRFVRLRAAALGARAFWHKRGECLTIGA